MSFENLTYNSHRTADGKDSLINTKQSSNGKPVSNSKMVKENEKITDENNVVGRRKTNRLLGNFKLKFNVN
jgi:hypothetical protein